MKAVESIECYWTTTDDPNFHELQKIMGYIFTKENGLILGVVKDRNNRYPEDHIVCGMEVYSRIVLLDIRSFDFLTPHKYDAEMDCEKNEGEGKFSSIGYMECGDSKCKIKKSEITEKCVPTKEELIQRIHAWMQKTNASSLYFFRFVLEQFDAYLRQDPTKRKPLDTFLLTIRLNPEKRDIKEKRFFDVTTYTKPEIIEFPKRTLRPVVEN